MQLGIVGCAEEEISLSSQLLPAIRLIPDLYLCCYITRVEFWLKTRWGQTTLKLPAVLPNYCSNLPLLKALLCSLSCSAFALPGLRIPLVICKTFYSSPLLFMLKTGLQCRPLQLLSHNIFIDPIFVLFFQNLTQFPIHNSIAKSTKQANEKKQEMQEIQLQEQSWPRMLAQ